MAQHNHSCSACLQLQQRLEDGLAEESRTLECYAGLGESAVPVRRGKTLLGYLQTGQVFLRAPTNQGFESAWRERGEDDTEANRTELRAAYFATRVFAPSHYESILRLLAVFSQYLGTIADQIARSQEITDPPTITKARAYITQHQVEELHLHDVARAAGMSDFYFCKLFRRSTGLTFTHYLARLRVDRAKRILAQPDVAITDAAYAAGFQSLSQFNRVFLRVAGETPTQYRGQLPSGAPRALSSAA